MYRLKMSFSFRNLLKVVTLFLQEPCIAPSRVVRKYLCGFFLMCASYFTYNSKIFQPQQILFHCLHYEQNPQQLKRALTFANLLVLNSVHASKTGKWFAARDNSSSVLWIGNSCYQWQLLKNSSLQKS